MFSLACFSSCPTVSEFSSGIAGGGAPLDAHAIRAKGVGAASLEEIGQGGDSIGNIYPAIPVGVHACGAARRNLAKEEVLSLIHI